MKRPYLSTILIALLTAAVACPPAAAQTALHLTLEQCRQQALEHNKQLGTARLKIQKQTADLKAMKTNFLPNFNLALADFYNTSKVNLTPDATAMFPSGMAGLNSLLAQLGQVPQYAPLVSGVQGLIPKFRLPDDFLEFKVGNVFLGAVTMTEPLYAGGKITAGYKMSKLGLQMANTGVRLTEQEVLLETDQAYVLCIRARQLGEIARSYRDLLAELHKNVEAAVRHGMKLRNDAMKVQVKLNEAELNIVKADNALRLAQMNLAHVIGLPLVQQIEVEEPAQPQTADPVVAGAEADISLRPEVDLLADKTEMARLNVKLTRSEFLPSLLLFGSYGYTHGLRFMNETLLKRGSATVGLALRMPLFHFGEGCQKVRSAKAAHQIAQLEQDDLTEKMRLEAMQAGNNLQEAALEVSITQKSVAQAQENLKMSKQLYEVGSEPMSDYLEAHAIWQQASADAVEARCNYILAQTKYRKATGRR